MAVAIPGNRTHSASSGRHLISSEVKRSIYSNKFRGHDVILDFPRTVPGEILDHCQPKAFSCDEVRGFIRKSRW
jgi:hypothetical protein